MRFFRSFSSCPRRSSRASDPARPRARSPPPAPARLLRRGSTPRAARPRCRRRALDQTTEGVPMYLSEKKGSEHYGGDEVYAFKDGVRVPVDAVSVPARTVEARE